MKLSKQERIAAIVVVILLILVAGVFLFIKPNFETIGETRNTLNAKKAEYDSDVARVETKEDLKKKILEAYDVGKNTADMFFPELAAYQADDEFRAFLEQCDANVLVEDLEVTAPDTIGLASNMFIPESVSYALKDYVNQGRNVDPTKTDPGLIRQTMIQKYLGDPQTIGATTVTCKVRAVDTQSLLDFADEVNSYQKEENGKAIRKAVSLSNITFEDLKTANEYDLKVEELINDAEKAAADTFKSKTGKTLTGFEEDNDKKAEEEDGQGSIDEVIYSMECSITFYSIERMQDPTERLNEQDNRGPSTDGTASDTTSGATSAA